MKICWTAVVVLGAALSVCAQPPDFTPPTPLIGAAMANDTAGVKKLLAAGANPNEGRFLGSPPIFIALLNKNTEAAKAMIEKGADVKALDPGGATTLMWAATSETADTSLVEELVRRGVDPNAKNKNGESALTWALRRGYTPMVEALNKAGASDKEMIEQSVTKALALLQKSGPEFVKVSGCTSCHNQSLPQMAYAIARERGLTIDEKIAQQQVKAVMAMFKPAQEIMEKGTQSIPDPAITVSYSLLGLAAEGYAPDATTNAMAHLVSLQQTEDGSFRAFTARPPIESSAVTATALSLRALQTYGKDAEPKVQRAREWLQTVEPRTSEERMMKLLGLAWAKADVEYRRKAAQAILAEQRPDGGWAQLPALESDAYATGQALVALLTAGQIPTSDPAYQRGMAFLLRTQLPDGSWLVRSRSFPFQPYKESGFPHGKDQWISAAGTSWAVMALTLTRPVSAERLSQVVAGE